MGIFTIILFCLVGYTAASNVGRNFSMVLVGGGLYDNNTEIWDTIVALGGGKGVARFGVISAASEDPCCDKDSSWVFYDTMLRYYGAAEVYYIPVTVNDTSGNTNPAVVEHVRTLTGFFFGGGDQLRIVKSYFNFNAKVPSPVLRAIKETLLASGGVVAGTSAGTDCQTGSVMISGGESYTGVAKGATVTWEPTERPDARELTGYGPGGIGLFPHGLLDTHFANRGRHGRLVQLMRDSAGLTRGDTRAFGVDENTALVVTGEWTDRRARVVGQRGAWVFSAERAVATEGATSAIEGVSVTRISNGDSISLSSYEVNPAGYKQALSTQSSTAAETSTDIFAEDAFEVDRIALSLLQSAVSAYTTGTSLQTGPQVTLRLDKSWQGAVPAVGYGGTDPSTGEFAYCFSGLWLSMEVPQAR